MSKLALMALLLGACGLSARDNEMVGQVKKVVTQTPLICGDYVEADVSLGIVRNGTGSVSREDVILRVDANTDVNVLKHAAEAGIAVKISYDIRRIAWCGPDHVLNSVVLLDESAEK